MKFVFGKSDFKTMQRGQESCYLLANGKGGFSSMTIIGSNARNDHALFMPCLKAPNNRYHMITKLDETLQIGTERINLSSQEYVTCTKNQNGFKHLSEFRFDMLPVWTYQVGGVEIIKTVVMQYGRNAVGIQYEIKNRTNRQITVNARPYLQFVRKGEKLSEQQEFKATETFVESKGLILYYKTNGKTAFYKTAYIDDLYFADDAKDDRRSVGVVAHNHQHSFVVEAKHEDVYYIIYSMENRFDNIDDMISNEKERLMRLIDNSGIQDEIGKELVKSADQYISDRESTGGKTILAGYPFFEDWGRDTMIALGGCCISTRRFEDAKNIFRTFMKYCKNGIMPNIFPEGDIQPYYNTVDASLLFISSVYEYYHASDDLAFVREAFPVMKDIVKWYMQGTDFHIRMEEDGLISAGSGFEQVTWMDVRIGDVLPTPRHGKPVEINAYWYNDLCIMERFSKLLNEEVYDYGKLAEKVRQSFLGQFWNEKEKCLKDVVSGTKADDQVRCNQIWAVSVAFGMLSAEQELKVVDKVFEKLYTPYGLRSLSPSDEEYHPFYGGTLWARDTAYHQGTVWGFPLGGYYLAYLKVHGFSEDAKNTVRRQLGLIEAALREGCVGHIAEIYDGDDQGVSKGCFAQAWSVGELLRVFAAIEQKHM